MPPNRLRAAGLLVAFLLGRATAAELPNLQDPKVQYDLGMSQLLGREGPAAPAEGVVWLRKAAVQGYADAQVQLGVCYQQGLGVEKDLPQALAWFRRAADQGNARGQLQVALAYRRGDGVAPDLKQALGYLQRAAEQGHPKAQFELGVAYRDGLAVAPDPEQAAFWLGLAAGQGSMAARMIFASAEQKLSPEQRGRVDARRKAWIAQHPPRTP